MSLDEDLYNQPTELQRQLYHLPSGTMPAQASTSIPASNAAQPGTQRISRRALMGIGASVAGLGGGIALEQYIQRGGLSSLLHGPAASSIQTGHLLRRAGF